MTYHVRHTTAYHYTHAATLSQNEARVVPRSFGYQTCLTWRLDITPQARDYRERVDHFGNRTCYFAVEQPHTELAVTAVSEVHLADRPNLPVTDLSWDRAVDEVRAQGTAEMRAVHEFILDSPLVHLSPELGNYALTSFAPGRGLVEACTELNTRISTDFEDVPGFTTISTPLDEVMRFRRGVCQDFAHVAIGCLRSIGIPARYVSGYLETVPPEGERRLQGADASHAWISVFVPAFGWVDFDPTNNVLPDDRHISVAWGRDFNDATPLKGVVYSGGEQHLEVAVHVERVAA